MAVIKNARCVTRYSSVLIIKDHVKTMYHTIADFDKSMS